jgi:hypothetical protein
MRHYARVCGTRKMGLKIRRGQPRGFGSFQAPSSEAKEWVPPRSGLQNRLGPEFGPVVRHRDSEFSCALPSMSLIT